MGSGSATLPAKRSLMAESDSHNPNKHAINGTSTKRSKKKSHSAVAAATAPLVVPPGHTYFRLICHSSRVGGVSGKAGAVIKQLQSTTAAKIRVEVPPAESPDRIISVVAPSGSASKILLKSPVAGAGGGEEVEVEVSKAQEALLRVFDRILEVAAESGTVGFGVVSCRLLADEAQAGAVIGKGGKVVEKIRKETGCKIRVLKENLPSGAASTDEIIEIEGDVLAVKKGLVAVSQRLQDYKPVDKSKTLGSRHTEAVPQETLPDLPTNYFSQRNFVVPTLTASRHTEAAPQKTLPNLQADYFSQRNFVVPTLNSSSINLRSSSIIFPSSSVSYTPGLRPLTIESERLPTLDTKVQVQLQVQVQDIVFKLVCANDKIGGVIGKGGSIVKALQSETGASISVGATVAECDDRLITITASENPESRYSPAQKAVVLVFSKSVEEDTEKDSSKGSSVTARLLVPSNQVGCLLGKGGIIISEIRKTTGASIKIFSGNQLPKCASANDEVVQISGEFSCVRDALYNATGRLRDNVLSNTVNSAGTRSAPTLITETSPYERMREHETSPYGRIREHETSPYGRMREPAPLIFVSNEPPPLEINDLSSFGVTNSHSRNTTLNQNLDYLGLPYSVDRPPSPRPWASQMVAGASTRGIPETGREGIHEVGRVGIHEIGRGLTSLKGGFELGSVNKSAIVTNTTVEIVVPENVIASVYGENGNNLTRLRQISGARVIVHEPRSGTSDRVIVISGTPDETQAAQSLLHAFILTGPS